MRRIVVFRVCIGVYHIVPTRLPKKLSFRAPWSLGDIGAGRQRRTLLDPKGLCRGFIGRHGIKAKQAAAYSILNPIPLRRTPPPQ